jgi:hypothetical protein
MTTTQTPAKKAGSAAAKNAAAAQAAKAKPKQDPAAPAKKAAAKEPKQTAPAQPTYREVEEFVPALKAAKSAAKGNADLMAPLTLITHLGWKTPGGSVGWAKGTTQAVTAYADDIAVPAGTPVPDAMTAAIAAAKKAAKDDAQKSTLASLEKVIDGHNG